MNSKVSAIRLAPIRLRFVLRRSASCSVRLARGALRKTYASSFSVLDLAEKPWDSILLLSNPVRIQLLHVELRFCFLL